MKIIELSGTHYEMGYELGLVFKKYLQKENKKFLKHLKDEELVKRLKTLKTKLRKEFPSAYEEIRGKAKGAEVEFLTLLLMYSPELLRKDDGCTTSIMFDKKGEVFLSHNEDERDFNRQNCALVKYNFKDYWVMGYARADQLIGSCFSFNSHGLLFTSNYLFPNKKDLTNLSRYIWQRALVDCKDLKEFEKKIKKVKVASPFCMSAIDINTKKAIVVEKDIDKIYVKKVTDRFGHANHFILKKGKINKSESSNFRSNKTNELLKKLNKNNLKLKDLKKVMDYQTKNYFKCIKLETKDKDKSKTVVNFSYSSKDNVIILNDYLNNKTYFYLLEK